MKDVVDRVVQYPNRYKLVDTSSNKTLGTFDLYEEPGTVRVEGTPVDAALFDSIREDISMNAIKLDNILDNIYPVGSIFLSTSDVNPGTYLYGTTWERWGVGRVPFSVDESQEEFSEVEKTGGEKEHTLNPDEMPKHYHRGISWGTNENSSSTTIVPIVETAKKYVGIDDDNFTENVYQVLDDVMTDLAGESIPHNILNPYITCYMWKRTA